MELRCPGLRDAFYPASTFSHIWFAAKEQSNISGQVAIQSQFKYEIGESQIP
jgi:hypothetical protein